MVNDKINEIIYNESNDGNLHMHNENFDMEQEL